MQTQLLNNGAIVSEQTPPSDQSVALFRLAFRPFFLFGALFSIVALLVWNATVTGQLTLNLYGGPLWWHMHEMLFGFVSAIVAGFLLTAVQTWTGLPSLKGVSLLLLFSLWLAGRVLMWLPSIVPGWLIVIVDLLFLPTAAICMASLVVQVKMWRNLIFLPLLLAMTFVNATMHCAAWIQRPDIANTAAIDMVLLVTLLMSIIGGRVIPMFTANGTRTQKVAPIGWLEKATILSMLLVVITFSGLFEIPQWLKVILLFIAAVLQIFRVLRWRIWVTFKTPLVWSLHISYWCIPLGLVLLGLSEMTGWVSRSQAVHSFTVGGVGLMILSMISRVSLGHSGRIIQVGKIMLGAFLLLGVTFTIRVFGLYWFDSYSQMLTTSTILWSLAYGCFVVIYWPILSRPRIDGKPG